MPIRRPGHSAPVAHAQDHLVTWSVGGSRHVMSTEFPDHCSTPLLNNGTAAAGRFVFLVPNYLVHLLAMSSEQGTQYDGFDVARWSNNLEQRFGDPSPRAERHLSVAMGAARPIHGVRYMYTLLAIALNENTGSNERGFASLRTGPHKHSWPWIAQPQHEHGLDGCGTHAAVEYRIVLASVELEQRALYAIAGSATAWSPISASEQRAIPFARTYLSQPRRDLVLTSAQGPHGAFKPSAGSPYSVGVRTDAHATQHEPGRYSLPVHDERWRQDAPDIAHGVGENKARSCRRGLQPMTDTCLQRKVVNEPDDEGDQTAARDSPATAKKRRKGTSRGAAATRAARGDSQTASQSKTRRKRRPNASPSTDELGPSVQSSNKAKPGAKPALPCGVALKNVNATKQGAILEIVKRVRNQALSTDAVLTDLPLHEDRPTAADLKSFKTALAEAVAAEADVSPTRKICNDCSAQYGTPVPLGPKTKLARHRHDYHSPGLQKCNVCGYLVLGRAESMHEHYGRCPVLRPLVETDRHGAWLRKHNLLSPPSRKFFKQEAFDIAEGVQGDQAAKERALLDWMQTHDYRSSHRAGSHAPAATATSASGAVPAEHGEEGDEDADSEHDLDVDDNTEGSVLDQEARADEAHTIAFSNMDGGSIVDAPSGQGVDARGAHGRDDDPRVDSGDGAQHAAARLEFGRNRSGLTRRAATELVDELSRVHEGVLGERYGSFDAVASDAERDAEVVVYGESISWNDGDVIERTVGRQSGLDGASSFPLAYDDTVIWSEDPYHFHDTMRAAGLEMPKSEELDAFFS
ncbi:hypothetical protein EXIGLDRAFT_754058 [Exidia glandulosa HHB12029]|uniref:Uncharacterized protein n=1 Tax=Exidia glandulosa HHB12029 TaxID=1314781 RepID=A0A165D9X3_EXIGL|nr:hypothetical protein EXIGLDRAFT_754058 [Exidia glandulosa HHB12029]